MKTIRLITLSILLVLCLMATGAALGEEAADMAPALVDEVPNDEVKAEDEIVDEVPDDNVEVEAVDEVADDMVEVDEGEVTIESKTDDGAETYVCRYCVRRYSKRGKPASKSDVKATDSATDTATDDAQAETVVCKYCGRSFVKGGADDASSYVKGSRGGKRFSKSGSSADSSTDSSTDSSADGSTDGSANSPNMKGGSKRYFSSDDNRAGKGGNRYTNNNRGTTGCSCGCSCQNAASGDDAQTRSSDRAGNRQKSTKSRPKG